MNALAPEPSLEGADVARWRAVLDHDRHADGQFYYAVRSTGVYCRPSCPSRRPRRENVEFFEAPEAARAAGFRACLRCKPGEVSRVEQAVAGAKHLLDQADPAPSLAMLASSLGLSPWRLQRVFKERVGVSPKQYALRARAERLKDGLRSGASVTAAMYDAGHGSASTLYAPATDQLGMPPLAYGRGGAGQTITARVAPSPLGAMLVAATARGLCAVRFGEPDEMLRELRAEYPQATIEVDAGALQAVVDDLAAHLSGRRAQLAPVTDTPGTAFQRRVWEALRGIPYGETRTYAQVAEMIGEPRAARAVARACAANPVALVVPCHRVVRSGGALSGYRWGIERKRALLEREAAGAPPVEDAP